ncbi:MAG: TIGR04255 family protein [Phycisphaerales bacterium]
MSSIGPIHIDLSERFERLSRAPIAEAVLELRCSATSPWDETEIAPKIKAALPDYPMVDSLRAVSFAMSFQPPSVASPAQQAASQQDSWVGLRVRCSNQPQIATLTRELFAFSRLQPYVDWSTFTDEAIRLWRFHASIAKPVDIQRVGARSINRIPVPAASLDFSRYFVGMTDPGCSLPRSGFLHQEVFAVPGHPYQVQLIRTMQPPSADSLDSVGLIVDIDVSTVEPIGIEESTIRRHLPFMRWLKNKVFFAGITEEMKVLCR